MTAPLRPNDAPKSFYPGMWLRRVEEGAPFTAPTAEVIRVGRTRVTIHHAGEMEPRRVSFEFAQKVYRKVYESEAPTELPEWVTKGAEFRAKCADETLKIRRIRWGCASVVSSSGVLLFWRLEALTKLGEPRRSTWDRLRDET